MQFLGIEKKNLFDIRLKDPVLFRVLKTSKKAGRYIIFCTGSRFHTQTRISPETTQKVEYFLYRTKKEEVNFRVNFKTIPLFVFLFSSVSSVLSDRRLPGCSRYYCVLGI